MIIEYRVTDTCRGHEYRPSERNGNYIIADSAEQAAVECVKDHGSASAVVDVQVWKSGEARHLLSMAGIDQDMVQRFDVQTRWGTDDELYAVLMTTYIQDHG